MTDISFSILFALVLDLAIGDPCWLPHPVRGIGYLIINLEKILRKIINNEKSAGVFLLVLMVLITCLSVKLVQYIALIIHPFAKMFVDSLIIYFTISIKDMYKESMGVYNRLLEKKIEKARKNLGRIVGRDINLLSEPNIIRGTVESTAEGIVDGILSPFFFAFIGGATFSSIYRTVNTLDSMVGYKNAKYINFGWASAKCDDILNYIPARLSGLCIPIAAFFCKKNWRNSLRTIFYDAKKHPSPNSGFPEAGVAGALEVQLGGDNYYKGILSKRPLIGYPNKILEIKDILDVNKIMIITSFIFVSLSFLIII